MNYQNLLAKTENGILFLTINRPDKMNSLNATTLSELRDAMHHAYGNEEIKGIILTGSGEKAFVAGADIAEFSGLTVEMGRSLSARGHEIFNLIERCPKPVIAAVNGFALGGGCELAMACHMRIAAENARFGQPEVNLGIIPGYGGTQRLIQLIGKTKAMELLMTADMLKAEEAFRLGLVNYVVPMDQLLPKCVEIVEKIKTKAPFAIGKIVTCVNAYFEDGTDGLNFEINAFGECCGTEDFNEGANAFLNKRKANFKGR